MNFFRKKSIKIPPPLVTLIFGFIMYLVALYSHWQISFPFQGVAALIMSILAMFMLVPAVFQFIQNQTTVNPLHPEKASKLVVTGLFRLSRNPMYLGMALLLLAWSVYLGSPLNVLIYFGFIAYMNHFQIRLEERALEVLFGDEFLRYKARVRRWI